MAQRKTPGHSKQKKFGSEEMVQQNTIIYIRQVAPGVIARSDVASGLWLPPWLASKFAKLQAGGKGYPDVTIMAARRGYHGLALELKADGVRLKKQNGDWSDERIAQQNKMLTKLDNEGYCAYFAVGLDEAKAIIDWYFGTGPVFNTAGRIPLITKPKAVDDGEAF